MAGQWLSRALDPASLRRACVLGGRIQSLGSRRSGTRLGGAGQWLSRALDPASGWAVVSRALDPVPAAHVGAWQWLSRALDPASRCVLGGWAVVSRALDPVAAAPSVSLAVVIQSLGSCLAGPYLEALTASCQVGGKGLGSGYPEPWILPGPWARNAAKLL